MTKILYIAGYGRSGSTILDIILGNHSEITGVGEVSYLLDEWIHPNRLCACGKPYKECQLWSNLFRTGPPSLALIRLVRRIEKQFFIPRLLLNFIDAKDRQAYCGFQAELFNYVATHTKSSVIVDSSKSSRYIAGRALALKILANQDVYMLHLVRSGKVTMESLLGKGSNWALEGYSMPLKFAGLRAVLGWVSANILASALGRLLGPNRYMLLRYEDFIADPEWALQDIGRFCGFDAEELIAKVRNDEYFQVGHLVGGNRVRLQNRVRLRRNEQPSKTTYLKLYHRVMFTLIGGWLQNHYGYQ